jgi:hypothetical protein
MSGRLPLPHSDVRVGKSESPDWVSESIARIQRNFEVLALPVSEAPLAPYVIYRESIGAASIPDATWSSLTFDNAPYTSENGDGVFDLSSAGQIQILKQGLYLSGFQVQHDAGAGGTERGCLIELYPESGPALGAMAVDTSAPIAAGNDTTAVFVSNLDAGLYLEPQIYQDSGGPINYGGPTMHDCVFWTVLLRETFV